MMSLSKIFSVFILCLTLSHPVFAQGDPAPTQTPLPDIQSGQPVADVLPAQDAQGQQVVEQGADSAITPADENTGAAQTEGGEGAVVAPAPAPAPVLMSAESNPDNILNPITDIERALSEQLMYLNPQINVNTMSSLFLSDWEHDLITDARLGLTTSGPLPIAETPDTGLRDISLGGIVFRSSSDWTIWLNNARVTPNAIPTQVMDIKVYKEYIELEWFDRSKNLIYPIRLRAHQRFNLDTRMFLPG
jgi:hypothetical protein